MGSHGVPVLCSFYALLLKEDLSLISCGSQVVNGRTYPLFVTFPFLHVGRLFYEYSWVQDSWKRVS